MSGVRPDSRFTFLLCGKKVSKETHPLRRPFGLPSLRRAEPADAETRFAQTAASDFPGSTHLHSAVQKGYGTPLVSAPHPNPLIKQLANRLSLQAAKSLVIPQGEREQTRGQLRSVVSLSFKGRSGAGMGCIPLLAR